MWGCTYIPAAHKDRAGDRRDEPVGPRPPLPMGTSREQRLAAVSPSALPVGFAFNVFCFLCCGGRGCRQRFLPDISR